MGNSLRLFLLLVLVASLTYWWSFVRNNKSTVAKTDRDFAVSNIEAVHKIFIADRDGQTATLEKQGNHWLYEGKWKANPNVLKNLLVVLEKVRLKYIPPKAAVEPMIKDLATNGIKVELYDKIGQKLKAYYVGGVTNDELGTYMIMEESNNPYVMYMPGFEGSLRGRYVLKEKYWRDKTIFNERLEKIQSVVIEYPKQKSNSFRLSKTNDGFDVSPLFPTTTNKGTPNQGKIAQFLRGFDQLVAEAFENQHPARDSIVQQLPFCIITVERTNGDKKEIRLHPIQKRNRDGQPLKRDDGKLLIERYYANVDNRDLMLIQELVFAKVLWGYDYFF